MEFLKRAWTTLDHRYEAKKYLLDRGLLPHTIAAWHLGYTVPQIYPYALWGLSVSGEKDSFVIRPGIVIPWFYDGRLAAIKIRNMEVDSDIKYSQVARGETGPYPLYGMDKLSGKDAVLIVEGEFDAMSVWQAAGDVVDVLSVSGASQIPDSRYLAHIHSKKWLLGFDGDEAGRKAARKWISSFGSHRCRDLWRGRDHIDWNGLLVERGGAHLRGVIEDTIKRGE